MQKIEGVKLPELVKEANKDLFEEDRKRVSEAIKKVIYRATGLKLELKEVEKKRSQILEKIEKADAKLEKIKQGDWSVLNENQDEQK